MSTQSRVYVFCAIREKRPQVFGKVTLNGEESEVYTLHFQNTAMVVTKVNDEILPNRNNLFAHQKTITKIMEKYTPIPFSFGNIFHSEKDVLLITEYLHGEFEKLFPHLENKMEVGLKVMAKKAWLDQLIQGDPVLSKLKNSQKDAAHPADFYGQIQIGEQAKNFVLQLEEEVEREIYQPLEDLAEAGKQNDTIPGKILLNAAFLVDRGSEEEFDLRVNDLYERWKDKVEFKYTGPWPAYNFVNIHLRIEGKP